FQRQNHDRPAGHKRSQGVEKRPAGVHGIKALRLPLGDLQQFHPDDAETIVLKRAQNVSRCAFAYSVGFNDGKRALQCLHSWFVAPVRALNISRCSLGQAPRSGWAHPNNSAISASSAVNFFVCVRVRSVSSARANQTFTAPIRSSRVWAIMAGDFATAMPADSRALIFSAAVPCPPEMIAPAWPMRRPGGAVCPAINETTGFCTCFLTYSAAISSA